MTSADATFFISNEALSRLPGVGDDEVTAEEGEMAKQAGRAYFLNLAGKTGDSKDKANAAAENELDIPESMGRYRIFGHQISPSQPLYKVGDDPDIEGKLNSLRCDNSLEYSMVVVSAPLSSASVSEMPVAEDEKIVFLLSGGGFASSDSPFSKLYYLRISKELGMRVFVSRYSTIPDHAFPRALHDVYTSYNHLVGHCGFQPKNIVLLANSAGCNLALGALQLLKMQGQFMPARCVLVSPLLDLTLSQDSWRRNLDHCVLPMMPLSEDICLPRLYFGPSAKKDVDEFTKQLCHPLLSPLFCDPTGFPPMQIQVGDYEVLLDDAKEFEQRARKANVPVELIIYPQINHYTILRGKTQLDKVYGNKKRFFKGF
ncbi:hypothetical protein EV175_000587 [Coemansia sp. RSA 1933]|nr:hypothetical protein EV175_000587 [Coemansia sp. RSA 1933]